MVVAMVRHKQPASLYALAHSWVCCYIGDRLVNTGYDSPAQQTLATVRSAAHYVFCRPITSEIFKEAIKHTFNSSLSL